MFGLFLDSLFEADGDDGLEAFFAVDVVVDLESWLKCEPGPVSSDG